MSVDREGNVTIAWSRGTPLFTTRYDALDGVWQEPQVVGETQWSRADFAYDETGNGVAVWYEYPDAKDLPYELWANFRTPDGQWGEPQQIDESENPVLDPSVSLDSQGRVVAAWEVYNCWIPMALDQAEQPHPHQS